MFVFAVRRIMVSVPLLIGITIIVFALATMMPGDALLAMFADEAGFTRELLAQQRTRLGLDEPVIIQYVTWLGRIAQGNLGMSLVSHEPVAYSISLRLGPTLQLMGVALAFSLVVGVTLGVVSALKQNTVFDHVLTVIGFIGISMPVFVLGLLFVYVFSLKLNWFPSSGMRTPGQPYDVIDNLRHLVLPALAIGMVRTVTFMRYTRNSMLEVLSSDYLNTARAKGLAERKVIWGHALRNALSPLVTAIGLALPTLLAGAVYIETVFQWPGTGLLFIRAVNTRDTPMIMGLALVFSLAVMIANLLTDLAYAFIDPRVRYD
jgi:peptide/nickel transport system permease protein